LGWVWSGGSNLAPGRLRALSWLQGVVSVSVLRPRFRQHVRAGLGLVRAHKKPRRRTRARLALLADPGYIFFERSCGWHKTNCFYGLKRAQAFLSVLLICAPRPVAELQRLNFQTATESVLLPIETGVKANTRCQNTFSRGEWELYTRL
jgi:hypothetical protein